MPAIDDARAEQLRVELLAMAATDQRVRAELVEEGTLFKGYHPRMADVHRENARRLRSSWMKSDGRRRHWSGVDERRKAAGPPSLAERILEMRQLASRDGVRSPDDFTRRRREIHAWEISVGWDE